MLIKTCENVSEAGLDYSKLDSYYYNMCTLCSI